MDTFRVFKSQRVRKFKRDLSGVMHRNVVWQGGERRPHVVVLQVNNKKVGRGGPVVLVKLDAVTDVRLALEIVSAQSLTVTISVSCNRAVAPPQDSQALLSL